MPYKNAKACFEDNVAGTALRQEKRSAERRKVSRGLRTLTEAIEKDLQELHDRIDRIEEILQKTSGDEET